MKKSFIFLLVLLINIENSPPSYANDGTIKCQYFVKDFDLEYSADQPLELDLKRLEVSDPLNRMRVMGVKLAEGKARIIYDSKIEKFYISINNRDIMSIIPNRNYILNRNWVLTYRAKGENYIIGEEIEVEDINMDNITTTYAMFFVHRIGCHRLLSRQDDRIQELKASKMNKKRAIEFDVNQQIIDRTAKRSSLNADITSVKNYARKALQKSYDEEIDGLLDFESARQFAQNSTELENIEKNIEEDLQN